MNNLSFKKKYLKYKLKYLQLKGGMYEDTIDFNYMNDINSELDKPENKAIFTKNGINIFGEYDFSIKIDENNFRVRLGELYRCIINYFKKSFRNNCENDKEYIQIEIDEVLGDFTHDISIRLDKNKKGEFDNFSSLKILDSIKKHYRNFSGEAVLDKNIDLSTSFEPNKDSKKDYRMINKDLDKNFVITATDKNYTVPYNNNGFWEDAPKYTFAQIYDQGSESFHVNHNDPLLLKHELDGLYELMDDNKYFESRIKRNLNAKLKYYLEFDERKEIYIHILQTYLNKYLDTELGIFKELLKKKYKDYNSIQVSYKNNKWMLNIYFENISLEIDITYRGSTGKYDSINDIEYYGCYHLKSVEITVLDKENGSIKGNMSNLFKNKVIKKEHIEIIGIILLLCKASGDETLPWDSYASIILCRLYFKDKNIHFVNTTHDRQLLNRMFDNYRKECEFFMNSFNEFKKHINKEYLNIFISIKYKAINSYVKGQNMLLNLLLNIPSYIPITEIGNLKNKKKLPTYILFSLVNSTSTIEDNTNNTEIINNRNKIKDNKDDNVLYENYIKNLIYLLLLVLSNYNETLLNLMTCEMYSKKPILDEKDLTVIIKKIISQEDSFIIESAKYISWILDPNINIEKLKDVLLKLCITFIDKIQYIDMNTILNQLKEMNEYSIIDETVNMKEEINILELFNYSKDVVAFTKNMLNDTMRNKYESTFNKYINSLIGTDISYEENVKDFVSLLVSVQFKIIPKNLDNFYSNIDELFKPRSIFLSNFRRIEDQFRLSKFDLIFTNKGDQEWNEYEPILELFNNNIDENYYLNIGKILYIYYLVKRVFIKENKNENYILITFIETHLSTMIEIYVKYITDNVSSNDFFNNSFEKEFYLIVCIILSNGKYIEEHTQMMNMLYGRELYNFFRIRDLIAITILLRDLYFYKNYKIKHYVIYTDYLFQFLSKRYNLDNRDDKHYINFHINARKKLQWGLTKPYSKSDYKDYLITDMQEWYDNVAKGHLEDRSSSREKARILRENKKKMDKRAKRNNLSQQQLLEGLEEFRINQGIVI